MIGLSSRSEEIILFCDTLNPSLREGLSQIWYDSSSIFCSLTPQDIMLVSVSFLNHGLVGDFFFFSLPEGNFTTSNTAETSLTIRFSLAAHNTMNYSSLLVRLSMRSVLILDA